MTHRFLVLALLAACSGSDAAPATLTATWSLRHPDGSPATCSTSYATIKLSAFAWNKEFDGVEPSEAPVTQLFDCAAGTGTMMLPTGGTDPNEDSLTLSGKYDVSWTITDATGQTELASDVQTQLDAPLVVDLSHGDAAAAMTLYPDAGYVWLEWGLFGTTAGQDLATCAAGEVDRIDVALTDTTTSAVTPLSFPCDTADATATGAVGVAVDDLGMVGGGIAPLPAGEYSYVATAYAGATAVGASDPDTVTIQGANHVAIIPDETSISLSNR